MNFSKMELHEIGVERLIAGIYKQAAKDYIEALTIKNKYQIKTIRKFLKSGAFGVEIGEAICAKIEDDFKNGKFESVYRKDEE